MQLAIEALSVSLDGRPVLADLSVTMEPGRVIGLLGPNGAGKSTLMRAIAAQLDFTGTIRLGGSELAAYRPRARARRLSWLPQTRTIGWRLSVTDLVALGRLPWRRFGQQITLADQKLIDRAMEMADIAHLRQRTATELSGGEQARVLMARAIAQDTPLLMADEPASGLDPAHQITLMQAFSKLAGEGRTVLVSLHDLTLAARWCDEVLVLKNGRLAAIGTPEKVMTDALLADVYGVSVHRSAGPDGLVVAPVALVETERD